MKNVIFPEKTILFMENDDECAISCIMTMVCFDFEEQKSVQVFNEIKKEFKGEMK